MASGICGGSQTARSVNCGASAARLSASEQVDSQDGSSGSEARRRRTIRFVSHKRSTHPATLLEGAPRRALGRDTSALPLTRWRSGTLPMHRTASFPIHHVKQRSLLHPRRILASGFFSFLFSPSSVPTPERGDWRSAQRRPALYVSRSNARRHACEAIAPPAQPVGPPHGAPPWRCRPRSHLRLSCGAAESLSGLLRIERGKIQAIEVDGPPSPRLQRVCHHPLGGILQVGNMVIKHR